MKYTCKSATFFTLLAFLWLSGCAGTPVLDTPPKQLAAAYAGLSWADKQVATLVATKDDQGKRLLPVQYAQLTHDCIVKAHQIADLAKDQFKAARDRKQAGDLQGSQDAYAQALKYLRLAQQAVDGLRIALTAAQPGTAISAGSFCQGV